MKLFIWLNWFLVKTNFITCFVNSSFELIHHQCVVQRNVTDTTIFSRDSLIQCADCCLMDFNCIRACYNYNDKTCIISHKEIINKEKSRCSTCTTLLKNKGTPHIQEHLPKWELLFRATAGINIPTYETFLGTYSGNLPKPSDDCLSTETNGCQTHFRNPKIDTFQSLNITKIKMEFFKNGKVVAFVVLGGYPRNGSITKTSWFRKKYVIKSTWPDLNKRENMQYFTLEGYKTPKRTRRFYIIKRHGFCSTDKGWFMVIDNANKNAAKACLYDVTNTVPEFVYSNKNHYVDWTSANYDYADVFAISAQIDD